MGTRALILAGSQLQPSLNVVENETNLEKSEEQTRKRVTIKTFSLCDSGMSWKYSKLRQSFLIACLRRTPAPDFEALCQV